MLARVDFRKGALTGEGGFDSVSGSGVAITETDTGVGIYAADWTSDASNYGVLSITASDEVYVYIYLILDAAPSADQTVLQILNNSTVVGEIDINTSRQLELKQNGSQIGSASSALTLGTLYRIGLRQKVGTGADAELQGYLAEGHATLASFASAADRSFTTQADEIRAGACDAVALDGRIGYLAAADYGFPKSWLDLHDMVVGPLGFMGVNGTKSHAVADLVPAYDRAALGERRHDTFQTMSFVSQANFSGGVGQSRLVSSDRILTGIADTRFSGYAFPPRKKQDEADGGTAYWYFNRGSTLYGITATNFEQVGTATQVAHGGLPVHAPAVDGQNNVYWATTSNGLRLWDGSAVSSILPTTVSRAKHVAQYGRHVWLFGEVDIPTIDYVNTKRSLDSAPSAESRTWTNVSVAESPYSLTVLAVYIQGSSATEPDSLDISTESAENWNQLGSISINNGASIYMRCNVYYRFGGGDESELITTTKTGTSAPWRVQFFNFEGVDPDSTLDFDTNTDAGTATAIDVTATSGADYQLSGVMSSTANDTPTHPTGWTEISETTTVDFTTEHAIENQQDTSVNWTGMTSGAYKLAWNVNLMEPTEAGQTQFTILATENEGTTWAAAPANFSLDLFGSIRASTSTAGALWLVTDRGLFRMIGQVNETAGGAQIVDVGVTQHDRWEIPVDDNAGKWIASFQGLMYYPVGATIRRYAPNSSDPNDDRAFWPGEEWATVADQVQALVANEGGIWFGSSGYLWNYNGRGFHQMAAEPAAGAFDYLYWHQGKLYVKADPADYYNYHYPTVRPDILIANGDLDQDDFDTGYVITSSLDFEKVADPKVIRLLESQASFSTQNSNSGSLAFHYRNGCGTDADPGVGSGGDTGATWTSWGTHGYADGGYERHVLTTPLQCYRLYVRATLTPGTSGIPILHFFTVWGQGVMPSVKAITFQVRANVNQVNRENGLMWGSADEVKKALRTIRDWRNRITPSETLTFPVWINDGTDGGDEYLTTITGIEYFLSEESNDRNRTSWEAVMKFEELPS